METLETAEFLLIEQRPDWLECQCPMCCEISNQYSIYLTDANFRKRDIREFGKMVETSNCCCRFLCRRTRSFKMEASMNGTINSTTERPFMCPLACLCRPIINVSTSKGDLGQVFQHYIWCLPWCRGGCCSMQEIDVKDTSGNVIFLISGPICQLGFLLMGCGIFPPCHKAEYKILDEKKQHVGSIYRIYNDLCLELYTRADKYGIAFPANIDVGKKILLIHATMFLDYLQYAA